MSLPSQQQARAFFEPLRDRLTVFSVDDRESNLGLAKFLLDHASTIQERAKILDTDALYAANILEIGGSVPPSQILMQVPTDGLSMEAWLLEPALSPSREELLLIDDLNAVLHLLSAAGQRSSLRKLHLLAKFLSFLAEGSHISVLATTYSSNVAAPSAGREAGWRRTTAAPRGSRTMERIGDLSVSVSVEVDDSYITFESDKRGIWNGGKFAAPLRP